jgi:hypothetical protein
MLCDVRWKAFLVKFACARVIFYIAFQISIKRIVQSFSQQGDTQNDMKIETFAKDAILNVERREKIFLMLLLLWTISGY